MAPFSSVTVCLACLCLLSVAPFTASFNELSSIDEELQGFTFATSLACEIAKCVKGQCVNSSSLPFYKCECDAGWASPFGSSWLPCILPNCSIDLSCGNTTNTTLAPPPTPVLGSALDICSLAVCGNGKCVSNSSASNSSDGYECQCDTGYVNLNNQSDGYCIRKCALGADCANLGVPLGGSSSPPPPSSSSPATASPSNVNQGRRNKFAKGLVVLATLAFAVVWA